MNSSYINFNKSMAQVIIAENVNSPNEETYKNTIEMIDVNTILFNIMNIDTGINYKLYIKKNSEWCNENLYKIQNDFSQLYQIINDCIYDEESLFRYEIVEEKDMIQFLIRMKKDSKFFKVELDFGLERYISDNGMTADKLNSIEYQFNIYKDKTNDTISKLQEDNELLKKQVSELIEFKNLLKEKNKKNDDEMTELSEWKTTVQAKNKKEYDWLQTKWETNDDPNLGEVLPHNPVCGFHPELPLRQIVQQRIFVQNYENLNSKKFNAGCTGRSARYFETDNSGSGAARVNLKMGDTFESQLTTLCGNSKPIKREMFKMWFQRHMETLQV